MRLFWKPKVSDDSVISHCKWMTVFASTQVAVVSRTHLCGYGGVLWFILMAEYFKINRTNLESDLALRGAIINRILMKPTVSRPQLLSNALSFLFLFVSDLMLNLEVWVLETVDLLFAFLVYQVLIERMIETKLKCYKIMGYCQRENIPGLVKIWLADRKTFASWQDVWSTQGKC